MTIMDIALLSERSVATIDEAATISIETDGPAMLSGPEGRQLQLFLQRQELRLLACASGTPLARHIKVWRPEEAWQMQPAAFRNCRVAIEQNIGHLAPYGSFDGEWWHAGLTPDQHAVAIVPATLLILRRREVLVRTLDEKLAHPNLFALAEAIARAEQSHRPGAGQPVALITEAEHEIGDVAWWLHTAGPEPTGYDSRDARRKES